MGSLPAPGPALRPTSVGRRQGAAQGVGRGPAVPEAPTATEPKAAEPGFRRAATPEAKKRAQQQKAGSYFEYP